MNQYYLAAAGVLAVVELAEYRTARWAHKHRVYDWTKDPEASADFYKDEALDSLLKAVALRPDRVRSLFQQDAPPASDVAEGA